MPLGVVCTVLQYPLDKRSEIAETGNALVVEGGSFQAIGVHAQSC